MSETLIVRKRKKETVEEKITSLKVNAFALVREIKELSSVSFADISRGIDLYNEMRRFEIRLIQRALEETDGHQGNAARLLGLKMTTLNAKIKRYGLDPHDLPDNDNLSV
jgi:transcriptional regulator with GAF, ATPase, and Fis domain